MVPWRAYCVRLISGLVRTTSTCWLVATAIRIFWSASARLAERCTNSSSMSGKAASKRGFRSSRIHSNSEAPMRYQNTTFSATASAGTSPHQTSAASASRPMRFRSKFSSSWPRRVRTARRDPTHSVAAIISRPIAPSSRPAGPADASRRQRRASSHPRHVRPATALRCHHAQGDEPIEEQAAAGRRGSAGRQVGGRRRCVGQSLIAWLAEAGGLGTGAARRTASRAGPAVGVIQAA